MRSWAHHSTTAVFVIQSLTCLRFCVLPGPSGARLGSPAANDVCFIVFRKTALKKELAERDPWMPGNLMEAFLDAKRAWSHYMDDPNWSRLAWGTHHLEEERQLLGPDPWPYGVAANRANLERFIGYEHEQGLIPEPLAVDDLFFETTLET